MLVIKKKYPKNAFPINKLIKNINKKGNDSFLFDMAK